jgi:hypothetical protein
MATRILFLMTFVALASSVWAKPKEYVCQRTTSKITIDGKPNEWRKVPATDLFVDIEGDAKPRPRFATRAKMLWDTNYFYIAAEMEEPHVWGTLTKRDSVIFHDNDFEVFIDERRPQRILRIRDQRLEYRLGFVFAEAVPRRRQS